jgi:starvation-inducible DNA-binding protein
MEVKMAVKESTTVVMEKNVHVGISEEHRFQIAEGLCRVLADSYLLYLKTHNFHWNVTGPSFHSLHNMFEEQYTNLAAAIDEIAERIRALGFYAPGSFTEYKELTTIEEAVGVRDAKAMVSQLVVSNEKLIATVRSLLPTLEEASDEATLDLMTQRLHQHSKVAWMLRSTLE